VFNYIGMYCAVADVNQAFVLQNKYNHCYIYYLKLVVGVIKGVAFDSELCLFVFHCKELTEHRPTPC